MARTYVGVPGFWDEDVDEVMEDNGFIDTSRAGNAASSSDEDETKPELSGFGRHQRRFKPAEMSLSVLDKL